VQPINEKSKTGRLKQWIRVIYSGWWNIR